MSMMLSLRTLWERRKMRLPWKVRRSWEKALTGRKVVVGLRRGLEMKAALLKNMFIIGSFIIILLTLILDH